jgi:hypothetical protein
MHHDSVQPFSLFRMMGRLLFETPADGGTGGQGGSGAPGVFDSYLETVPEDQREAVTPYLRDAEKAVNGRLAEAATLQQNWGGYEEHVGAFREQYKPEDIAAILQWHQQVTADDNAYQQWLKEAAQQAGFIEGEEQVPPVEGDALTPEKVQELIDQRTAEALAPYQQRVDNWEQEQLIGREEQAISSAFSTLEAEHKTKLTPEQRDTVVKLGMGHEGDDWIKAGFEELQAIVTGGQRTFVAQAQQQPNPPLAGGGIPAVAPPTSLSEANALAKERFRQQNAQ